MATLDPKDDKYKLYAMIPDNDLLRWEEWVKIRKEEVVGISKVLNRPPVDLAMNDLEKVREKKEWQIALENAQLIKRTQWKAAITEERYRVKRKYPSMYYLQRIRAQLGRPNYNIEHIRVPDYIQQTEKGLMGISERPKNNIRDVDFYEYKEKRENKFKSTIKKIDPFRPDMKELVVIGTKPKSPPPKKPILPEIYVTESPTEPCGGALKEVYCLRVNNTIVFKEMPDQHLSQIPEMQKEPWNESCLFWTYYFNVPLKKMGRSKLYLKNLGTVTIMYCWKKLTRRIPYIPEGFYEQKFFFCKNEDVIPPGHEKYLYFTFISDRAGIYSETWELCIMNVNFFKDTNKKLIFDFVGDSVEKVKKITCKIDKLLHGIARKGVRRMINESLLEIVEKAQDLRGEPYLYKDFFLEGELFVMKNPICYYHQTEVQTLKEVYKEMTQEEWDLSIATWREAVKEKGYEQRMMYYNTLKTSHNTVLLYPWFEGDALLQEKIRIVKRLLGKLVDKFYIESVRATEYTSAYSSGLRSSSILRSNSVYRYSSAYRYRSISRPQIFEEDFTKSSQNIIHSIFYMRMYEHMKEFVETMSAAISSLDLISWIDYDFCQY